jgi:hypothetical protein
MDGERRGDEDDQQQRRRVNDAGNRRHRSGPHVGDGARNGAGRWMPPKNGTTTLATPCAISSWFGS